MSYKKYISLSVFLSASLIACSQPPARVGEVVSEIQTGQGVATIETENRYLSKNGKIAGEDSYLTEVTAKVLKVNQAKRMLTLQTAVGDIKEVGVGPEVRNFDQIKANDQVTVRYYTSVAFKAWKPAAGEMKVEDTEVALAGRAKLGEKPGMLLGSSSAGVVSVSAIDKSKSLITIRDSDGELLTLKAKYPENLSYIKVGDSVLITVTEALAIGVNKLS